MRKHTVEKVIAGLVCALLAAGAASAAGRDSGSRQSSERKSGASASSKGGNWRLEQEGWLTRLQGKFRVKLTMPDKITCRPKGTGAQAQNGDQICTTYKAVTYVGAAECRGTGEGPNLQCTFEALRKEGASAEEAGLILRSNQLPRELQFGIDEDAHKITVTMTDRNGSQTTKGKLVGNELTFKDRCAVSTVVFGACTWGLVVKASPDGRQITMTRTSFRSSATIDLSGPSGTGDPEKYELNRVE